MKEETWGGTAQVLMAMTTVEAAALDLLDTIDREREAIRAAVTYSQKEDEPR